MVLTEHYLLSKYREYEEILFHATFIFSASSHLNSLAYNCRRSIHFRLNEEVHKEPQSIVLLESLMVVLFLREKESCANWIRCFSMIKVALYSNVPARRFPRCSVFAEQSVLKVVCAFIKFVLQIRPYTIVDGDATAASLCTFSVSKISWYWKLFFVKAYLS